LTRFLGVDFCDAGLFVSESIISEHLVYQWYTVFA